MSVTHFFKGASAVKSRFRRSSDLRASRSVLVIPLGFRLDLLVPFAERRIIKMEKTKCYNNDLPNCLRRLAANRNYKNEYFMEKFIIDPIIKEQFEYYQNMCSLLSEFKNSTFAPPTTLEKIEKWEKENDFTLPQQYESWLLLTSESSILDQFIDFSWPEIGTLDEKNDIIGDGETAYISRSNGKVFSIFEGVIKEYDDFDAFLSIKSLDIESMAEDFIGEGWEDLYDEKYGDD